MESCRAATVVCWDNLTPGTVFAFPSQGLEKAALGTVHRGKKEVWPLSLPVEVTCGIILGR